MAKFSLARHWCSAMNPTELAPLQLFIRKLVGFVRAERGVAAVEFAMILPIMLAIYVGCTEAGGLLITDRKVQSVAGALGDIVARSNKNLARLDLADYFLAATSIMSPYTANDLVQTVTAVAVSDEGEATITWSMQFSNGVMVESVKYAPSDTFDLPSEMVDIARGHTVIAAEADYVYRPVLGLFFAPDIDLHRSNFFLPRFGGTIALH
jgi:Flp pilus assembly protein TadG